MSDEQFNDDGLDAIEPMEPEVHTWDEADEGDRRYDAMVEDQLFDRHTWPGLSDTFLNSVAIKERAA